MNNSPSPVLGRTAGFRVLGSRVLGLCLAKGMRFVGEWAHQSGKSSGAGLLLCSQEVHHRQEARQGVGQVNV